MAPKIIDQFEALRDLEENVAVGRDVLMVRTSRLYQDKVVFAALGRLHLDRLLTTLAEALDGLGALEWLGKDGDKKLDVVAALKGLVPKLPTLLPKVWAAARDVLGEQLVPFIEETAIVMLDTRDNAIALGKAGKIPQVETTGAWKGSPELRDYLLDNLSTAQAAAVVAASFRVSKWGDVLGNLMPLATGKTPAAETQTPTH